MFDRQEVFNRHREERLWGLRLAEEGDIQPNADFYVAKVTKEGRILRQPTHLRFAEETFCPLGNLNVYYLDRDGEPVPMEGIKLVEFLGFDETSSCLFLVVEDGVTREEVIANFDHWFRTKPVLSPRPSRASAELADQFLC